MTDLDLRLPDEKRAGVSWRPRGPSRLLVVLSAATLLVLLAFVVTQWLRAPGTRSDEAGRWKASLDRDVAERLADGGQYGAAASYLDAYARRADVPADERARLFYRVADYAMRAGEYERALAAFYRSELTAPLDELESDIKAGKKRCYEMLGNIKGWEQELKRLTDVEDRRPAEGETVVAELDGRRITMLELDRLIEARVSMLVSQAAPYVGPEELARRKEQLLKEFSTSEAKLQFLTGYVQQQLLMREALERGLHRQPEAMETLDQFRTSYLAQRVHDEEVMAAVPTPSDLTDYYEAHKSEFVEPERAAVSMIVFDTVEKARDAIGQLRAGGDFAELAKAHSVDEATRDAGGAVDGEVTRSTGVPGVGKQPELMGHVFALAEGATSAEPVELDGKFYVFMLRSRTPERTKSFEAVNEQVYRRKYDQRRAELMEALMRKLMAKYDAAIHPSAFRDETEDQSGGNSSSP